MSFAFIRKKLLTLNWLLPQSDPRHSLGRKGERVAAKHLRRNQHEILARRYRCPAGEVDLVCSDGVHLVFVEVKSRADFLAQEPDAAAQMEQWRRIFRAAQFFSARYQVAYRPLRFDLVTVEWPARGRPTVHHYPDAYHPSR